MFSSLRLYDIFTLSFVQMLVSTVLVLTPIRNLDTRLRWTGSRFTEVALGTVGAAAIAAISCYLTVVLWGLPAKSVESGAYLLLIFSVVVIIARPDNSVVGKIFYASYLCAGFTFLAFAAYVAMHSARSIGETLTASVLIILDLGAFMVWNSNISYVSDVMCRTRRTRAFPVPDPTYQPMVSVHIMAYNEPPEILLATIKSVEQQDYPNFEVIILDNNTPDKATWEPIEEYCRDRPRLKFFHVAPLQGYKAGACNRALRMYTDPDAEIIALVDADDIVKPYYLRETVSYFCDEQIGFVQTCEGNRDYEGSRYYTACVDSYSGFYLAMMSSRQERDTVPFVGTMGLFRRSALEEVGGWNEWCISEDTEASLRVLKAGWSGLYIPRIFGRGVVPPTFAGLNTQRHRWCFGGMQILRLHWRSLMPWDRSADNHLTIAQRRDYLMACLSWLRDLLMVGFAVLLLVVTALTVTSSSFVLMPLGGNSPLLPMTLIVVATLCMTWTQRHWTTISWRRAGMALVISLSAAWITALACVQGLTRREGVFLRTSKKGADRRPIRTALRLSRVETLLALSLYACAGLLIARKDTPYILTGIILVQGSVFLCSPITAFWNTRAQRVPAQEYRARYTARQLRRSRRWAPNFLTVGFIGALVLAVLGGLSIAVFSAPNKLAPVKAVTVGGVGSVTPVSPVGTGPQH
ncbi:MAG TPA: glycosyltransferase [Frankiaceae bacterium]|jgi:cellulose synthase/poly-beta-1,6-N-acetylglucosamine synthase-like glycosyltransferase|nr:glycosyltransferase [Frankiaceae bacterium]